MKIKPLGKIIVGLILIRPTMEIFVSFELFNVGGSSLNIAQLWGIFYLLICFLYLAANRINIIARKSNLNFFIFSLFLFIALFLSQDFFYGLIRYTKIMTWILTSFVLYDIFRINQIRQQFLKKTNYLALFVIGSYVLSFILVFFFNMQIKADAAELYAYSSSTAGVFGFRGFFNSTHGFSFLAVFMIILLQLNHLINPGNKKTYMFLLLGLSIIVLLSFARSSILAVAVFYLFLFRRNKMFMILSGSIIVIFSFYFISSEILESRFSKDFEIVSSSDQDLDRLGSGRGGMWRASLTYWLEQPLALKIIGSGFDADRIGNAMYYRDRGVHNDFIEILLNYGLISLMVFLRALYLIWKEMIFYAKRAANAQLIVFVNGTFGAVFVLMFFQGIISFINTIFLFVIIAIFISELKSWNKQKH